MKSFKKENKMKKFIKGRRIIFNPSANDFNNEPEYKLQKVRIYGESNSKKSYIIDSYGRQKFSCNKSQVFFNKQDFIEKMDTIFMFNLNDFEKEYLLKQFDI